MSRASFSHSPAFCFVARVIPIHAKEATAHSLQGSTLLSFCNDSQEQWRDKRSSGCVTLLVRSIYLAHQTVSNPIERCFTGRKVLHLALKRFFTARALSRASSVNDTNTTALSTCEMSNAQAPACSLAISTIIV